MAKQFKTGSRNDTAEMLLRLVVDGAIVSDRFDQAIRTGGLGKHLADAKAKLEGKNEDQVPQVGKGSELDDYHHLWLYEVPIATAGENKGKPLEGSCYWDRVPKEFIDKWKDREILTSDWRPDDPEELDDAFFDFIDSHIPRFNNLIFNERFYLYCEQARRELVKELTLLDIPLAEQDDWKQRELGLMSKNSLYGLNKIVTIKEDGFDGGRRRFEASAPHALVAYVVDLGKHFNLVKGRQAALTSEMMAIADLKMITVPSFTGVFMVHKKDGTGKTLFRDKHQSTLQHFPSWIIDEIDVSKGFSSESTIIDFNPGSTKATKGMDISEFRLLSAEDSMAVNGRTPTISLVDEAQNVPTYQKIKAEIDPTLYQFNKATGKITLVRQIAAWGTGSSNNTGQGAFENDFKSVLDAWQGREDTRAWTPLFFDWTCRPGMTRAFYEKQKAKYLRGQTEETKGLTGAERLSLFYAHYPSTPNDAFMSTHKTLIPKEIIIKQKQRISSLCTPYFAPVPGRFEPVFDDTVTIPGDNYFSHPIRDVVWKPSHPDDIEAPIRMFIDRSTNKWVNRYFQGTDPIQNDGGFSRFSSMILDTAARQIGTGDEAGFLQAPVCVLNSRSYNPADLFVQCALMGMYYKNAGQKACKELVEINVGHRYADFKCGPIFGLRESLLTRHQLLPKYKTGEAKNVYGIDLKGGKNSRKGSLYADITDFLIANWHNIWFYDLWSQIDNISVSSEADGSVQWGTRNKNVYNDDMVYAMGYADLCARCINKQPEMVSSDTPKVIKKRVIRHDANANPYYETIDVPITY